jgi:hypothetical protein
MVIDELIVVGSDSYASSVVECNDDMFIGNESLGINEHPE